MQFDHAIQEGVWVGSAEQIEYLAQAARDANFEGWNLLADYLAQIDSAHDEASAEFSRGPIAVDAWERYTILFRDAWEAWHAPVPSAEERETIRESHDDASRWCA